MTQTPAPYEPAEARERMLRDIDPVVVAERSAALLAWAERIGHPKRCKTGEVHPSLYCCLFCGAEMGETCRAELEKTNDK